MNVELITKNIIEKTLAQKPVQGKHKLEPLKFIAKEKKLPFGIIEDSKVTESGAEVHKKEGDLWHCLEGEVEFTCEGKLVKPKIIDKTNGNEVVGSGIKNGKKFILKPGDWLWIPPGQPHMHTCTKTARMVIIKVPKSS
ncbi:MAG: hypothetical protein Q7S34_04340 [bacterium]|nr:hypothetical protein [bacterium]